MENYIDFQNIMFYSKYYFMSMYMCLSVYLCTVCTCIDLKGQKRALDPPEL